MFLLLKNREELEFYIIFWALACLFRTRIKTFQFYFIYSLMYYKTQHLCSMGDLHFFSVTAGAIS